MHETVCRLAKAYFGQGSALAHIGVYGDPPDIKVWGLQLSAYLFALFVNKTIVGSVLFASLNAMVKLGNWIFSPLQPHPELELVVVMVLCPWLLTSLQFVIFDSILKGRSKETSHDRELHRAQAYTPLHETSLSQVTTELSREGDPRVPSAIV